MTRKLKKLILVLLISVFIFSSSTNCFGKFALTRKAYGFNETLGSGGWFWKTTRTLIAYVYFLAPVYVVLFSDALVFNVIEYWTDKNLIGLNEFDKNGIYVKSYQKGNEVMVLTYLNFGQRLNVEIMRDNFSDRFVLLREQPGKVFKDNRGKLEEISISEKNVNSKTVLQLVIEGSLDSSKVVEADDFKELEKKYMGEFY